MADKNIRLINGKPLISWTIESAVQVKSFTKVLVSTDDDRILEIAKTNGIAAPFKRPEEYCQDSTSTFEVVKHGLEFLSEKYNETYDIVVLLQPTSPLRTSESIESAIQLMLSKNATAVVSVTACEHSPLWSNTIEADLSMNHFLRDEVKNKRSQDLPEFFRLNGAIYICKVKDLLEQKTFFVKENIFAYKMTNEESVDIDTELDFIAAEILMKRLNY